MSGLRIIVFFGNLQLFYNLTMDMLLKGTSCKTSFYGAVALIIASMLVFCPGLDARDRSAKGVKLNYKSLNAKALKEYSKPVHPGRSGSVPFWNGFSYRFIYAPAFEFEEVPGAVKYRFTVRQAVNDNMTESMEYIGNGVESRNYSAIDATPGPGPYKEWTFKADSPQNALSPVWNKIPVGRTELVVEGLDKSGKVVSENIYWRSTDSYDGPQTVTGPCTSGFESLQDMPAAKVRLARKDLPDGSIEVTLKNTSGKIAFFNRLQLRNTDGTPIHGTMYSDNFITLMPHSSRTIIITPGENAGRDLNIFFEGWNSGSRNL